MRRTFLLATILAAMAAAWGGQALAANLPASGYLVFKDTLRGEGVVEVRDDATGRVVATAKSLHGRLNRVSACGDPHFSSFSRWRSAPTYLVNAGSVPSYLDASPARSELVAAQEAWEGSFATDCPFRARSSFAAVDGGNSPASWPTSSAAGSSRPISDWSAT
jgi:hypothetical protein